MAQSIKIFVPLGTQRFAFNRLINALNELVDRKAYAADEIAIQSAIYDLKPNFTALPMISTEKFNEYMRDAEVIITHSGVNSIITCMRLGKPFIIAPRLKKYKEHVDDHQLEIANLMKEKFGAIVLTDFSNLQSTIELARNNTYKPWVSQRQSLIDSLSDTLSSYMIDD